jgi:hypothetical protein
MPSRPIINRARVPATKELVEMIAASPLTYRQLEQKAGVGEGVIKQWVCGKHGGTALMMTCVGEVLGYRLKWEKIDG